MKDTKGKLKLNLVPNYGLEAVARVREFGCNKYPGDVDGYITAVKCSDMVEACRRHLLKHNKGELLDPESMELHLSHVACSAMMAIEILHNGMDADNMSLRALQSVHKGMSELPVYNDESPYIKKCDMPKK